jgi:glucose-6-phosphate dehydrogenase assembly protein OpcA
MAPALTTTPAWSDEAASPGEPIRRWSSRTDSIEGIERELRRIWTEPRMAVHAGDDAERHVAARSSVLNLVVIARRPETAVRSADTLRRITGRHPSRTLIISPLDPDGPSWIDARIGAWCVVPRQGAVETCAEVVDVRAGGPAGHHPASLIAPLLVHDLPVTVWWPGDVPFDRPMTAAVLEVADRLVVDGSTWSGDGLLQLARLAALLDRGELAVSDFALDRQARWREAIASVFDLPEILPFLSGLRRIEVSYAVGSHGGRPESTNLVKPVYHAAWLASRLGLRVVRPLAPVAGRSGLSAVLRGRHEVVADLVPIIADVAPGTTLRVGLACQRMGSHLHASITAEAETVRVTLRVDEREVLDRMFRAARKTDVDLLMEALEETGRDAVTGAAIRMASDLAGREGGSTTGGRAAAAR